MKTIRIKNSKILTVKLRALMPKKEIAMLDVGCAAGWFLKEAVANGMSAIGVEPEAKIARKAIEQNLNVRIGYFPNCMASHEKFDVIAFNDVFEHLVNPPDILSSVKQHLNKNGILLLNLPNSGGFIYRLAKAIARIGKISFFERMWQKDYQSPHLFYFDRKNLRQLAENNGFLLLAEQALPSIDLNGMWSRIHDSSDKSLITSVFIYIGTVTLYPLIKFIFPQDILVQYYKIPLPS